jgi:hypothetical protein
MLGNTTLLIVPLLSQEIHLGSELCNNLLEIFHARKLFADRCRQLSRHTIGRNTDRLRDILQCILHDCGAMGFAEQKTDGRGIRAGTKESVNG